MLEKGDHHTAVIGASRAGEELGQLLAASGVRHAAGFGHLRRLRRDLLLRNRDVFVVVVALDDATLERGGRPLRTLLSDLHTLPGRIYSVGVLGHDDEPRSLDGLGCDLYASSSAEATRLVRLLLERRPGNDAGLAGERFAGRCRRAPRGARRRTAREPGRGRVRDGRPSGRRASGWD